MEEPVAITYNRNDIGLMLLADSQARKREQWPLLNSMEILDVANRLDRSLTGINFDKSELLVIGDNEVRPLRSPFEPFRQKFIFIDTIFNAFPGKLIAAGGSVFKAFVGKHKQAASVRRQLFPNFLEDRRDLLNNCDVDIFFINCTKEEVEKIIRFAWDLLHDEERIMKIQEKAEVHPDRLFSCIDRCQNTTTIYYSIDPNSADEMAEFGWEEGGKMQFIHRSYPNKASVIGGFDLGPCMTFYDGHDFWATPFGAWSIATQTIILDVTRRSTSFEFRISKYINRGNCNLVIVNGNNSDLYQYVEDDSKQTRRCVRACYPVKNLRVLSIHIPHAKYQGLDERLAAHADDDEENSSEEEARWQYNQRKELTRKHEKNKNRFRCRYNLSGNISDYDGGDFNAYTLGAANAIFAARGKLDCITWRSTTTKEAFEDPVILYQIHHAMLNPSIVLHTISVDLLHRWFPAETVQKLLVSWSEEPGMINIDRNAFRREVEILHPQILQNLELSRAKAKQGVTLITQNPGRQWTASNNPIVDDVRNYYHPCLLQSKGPLIIGIPMDVFCLLRLAWRHPQKKEPLTWGRLIPDVFKLLMRTIVDLQVIDGTRLLVGMRNAGLRP